MPRISNGENATARAAACGYIAPHERWCCGNCDHSGPTMHKSEIRCHKHRILVAKGGICEVGFMPRRKHVSIHAVIERLERHPDKKIA